MGNRARKARFRADKEVGQLRFNRSRREALDQFSASLLERFGGDGITSGGGAPLGAPLGDILVAQEFITEEQRDAALAAQVGTGRRLGEVLVAHAASSPVATSRSRWPRSSDCRTVDLARYELDDEIVGRLPAPIALELRAIPLAVEGERVHVACADPLMEALETRLIEALEAPVALVVAAEDEIQWALDHCLRARTNRSTAHCTTSKQRAEARRKELAESAEAVVIEVDENAPIVKVVNLILEQAVRDRASDVHIEPQDDGVAHPRPYRRRAPRAHEAAVGHGRPARVAASRSSPT